MKKGLISLSALALASFLYGCATPQRIPEQPKPVQAIAIPKAKHYTLEDFPEKFNTLVRGSFTAKELDTYGACFDEVKSKVDWTSNPDIKIKLVKDKTFQNDDEVRKIFNDYKEINRQLKDERTHLVSCFSNINTSLKNAGIETLPEISMGDFLFSRENAETIGNLNVMTIAYAGKKKGQDEYSLAVNSLEDLLKKVNKKEVCPTIAHELAGHILVLGLKKPKPIKSRQYSTPAHIINNFYYLDLNIDSTNEHQKAEKGAGYVSWYANYPEFLEKRFHALLDIHKKIISDLEKEDGMNKIISLSNKYGRKELGAIIKEEGFRCIIRHSKLKREFALAALNIPQRAWKVLKDKSVLSRYPVEDIAETAAFMMTPGDYIFLNKDEGTRKKAHMLRRFYIENYGAQNVHFDLPFSEPEEYGSSKDKE